MIDLAFRNITRRKTRTILTIIGIAIGIAAIVAIGSISEGLYIMTSGEMEEIAGKITVFKGEMGELLTAIMSSRLTETDLEQIRSVDGVKEAYPIMTHSKMKTGQGIPEYILGGVEPGKEDIYIGESIKCIEGRGLEEGDLDVAVVGYRFADENDVEVGDYITLKGYELEVVGVYEETDSMEKDYVIVVPIETAKDILKKDEYSVIFVLPEDVDDVEEVADAIEEETEGIKALTSKDISRRLSNILGRISIFTYAIASISAIVGGLGVMNTMIMSVMERRREIGTLKALGGTNKFIMVQVLTESSAISMIGGILGVVFGVVGAFILNLVSGGMAFGIVTPKLLVTGMIFAVFLGIIGGLYPAYQASQLSPVEALRYE